MTKLYLIRHAEAEGNLYRIAQGQYNSILTDRGWRQVRALEQRFRDVPIDAVYSSDLYRTCATASALFQSKGLSLHRHPGLREIGVGDWEQRTWGEIARLWPEQMENFNHRLHLWHAEGAETPQQVLDRVLAAVREIASANDGRTVAVFSHGCAIRLLLAELQGIPLEQLDRTPVGDNTAVSLLEAEGGTLRVVFRDDNSHLKTAAYLAGEKVRRRAVALEPGLYFEPLRLPDQTELLTGLVSAAWSDMGAPQPFDPETLLRDASARPTLVGCLNGEPVGVVQFGPAPGWLSLACIRADRRKRGFGVQLIGQAVQHFRPMGAEALRIMLRPGCGAGTFFLDNGFVPAGETADGTVLEKDIRYLPEFLTGASV